MTNYEFIIMIERETTNAVMNIMVEQNRIDLVLVDLCHMILYVHTTMARGEYVELECGEY